MITEIFNCLHLPFFQPFLRKALLHCMKQTGSFSVSYVLCRHRVIPVPSPDCTLPPCTQITLCVQKVNPGLLKPHLLLLQSSPVLSGWEQPQLQDAPGESISGGYVRGQQVWHHTSISSGARDCDLEQVPSPAVKVQTSLCKEEL